MIEITAICQVCPWKWAPRKHEGPESDFARAKKAADAHARAHRGHRTECKRLERVQSKHLRIVSLQVEIAGR